MLLIATFQMKKLEMDSEALKTSDLVLITLIITSQSTGQCKAMFRFASHCFALPVISVLN
jgi:hypothetical protein